MLKAIWGVCEALIQGEPELLKMDTVAGDREWIDIEGLFDSFFSFVFIVGPPPQRKAGCTFGSVDWIISVNWRTSTSNLTLLHASFSYSAKVQIIHFMVIWSCQSEAHCTDRRTPWNNDSQRELEVDVGFDCLAKGFLSASSWRTIFHGLLWSRRKSKNKRGA